MWPALQTTMARASRQLLDAKGTPTGSEPKVAIRSGLGQGMRWFRHRVGANMRSARWGEGSGGETHAGSTVFRFMHRRSLGSGCGPREDKNQKPHPKVNSHRDASRGHNRAPGVESRRGQRKIETAGPLAGPAPPRGGIRGAGAIVWCDRLFMGSISERLATAESRVKRPPRRSN